MKLVADHHPYKEQKVRILNGGHTSMVLTAYLAGHDIVRECMEEVGLLVEPVKLISRVVYPFPDQPIELFFYQVRAGEGEPSPLVHQKLCWAPVEELDRYAFSPANREALAYIKNV